MFILERNAIDSLDGGVDAVPIATFVGHPSTVVGLDGNLHLIRFDLDWIDVG